MMTTTTQVPQFETDAEAAAFEAGFEAGISKGIDQGVDNLIGQIKRTTTEYATLKNDFDAKKAELDTATAQLYAARADAATAKRLLSELVEAATSNKSETPDAYMPRVQGIVNALRRSGVVL